MKIYSPTITGSVANTNVITVSQTSSLNALSASFAATSSYANSFTVGGTLTAQTINVQTITSSIDYVTGSARFGSLLSNTHQFTGSMLVTGSLNVNKGVITLPDSIHTSAQINFKNVGSESELMKFPASNYTMTLYGATDKIYWKTDRSIANQNILSLDTTGSIGMGTISPSGRLHIVGDTYASSRIYSQRTTSGASGTYSLGIQASDNSFGIVDEGQGNLTRLFISGSSGIYMNTTSNPTPDNAAPQLGVLANTGTDAVNVKHLQNGNNTVNIWQVGTSSHNAICFYKGDTQASRGLITVTTSGTTYNSVSDYRLKENIVLLENGLDRVLQLKPSKFNWIETGNESEGFIAHELQEIFPDAVTGEKDAVYSSTGNIKPQSVDYGRITPLLVKAIQELKAENDTLKEILQRNNIQ